MKSFSFIKINGAGNDFVLIDKKSNSGIVFTASEIAKICDRANGIGADGVLLIDDSKETDFEMQYFNADGSTGSLCGNGARCVIKYAELSKRIDSKQTKFSSGGQVYSGELLSKDVIKFNLQKPTGIETNLTIKINEEKVPSHFADTGSPHLVINIDEILSNKYSLADFPVFEVGREIRTSFQYFPGGVNVNFIKFETDKILIRSYERGVEAETLACGTGAVAAAIISNLIYKKNPPIKFITKSNAELIVNFDVEKSSFKNVSLTGPVEIEFEGNYSI